MPQLPLLKPCDSRGVLGWHSHGAGFSTSTVMIPVLVALGMPAAVALFFVGVFLALAGAKPLIRV